MSVLPATVRALVSVNIHSVCGWKCVAQQTLQCWNLGVRVLQ
jgi:hypothetical protein